MERGFGDKYSEWQDLLPPPVDDKTMAGYNIEMCFTYYDDDGMQYLDWAQGKVKRITNAKCNIVDIEWDSSVVAAGEKSTTRQKLVQTKWNPDKAVAGGWREYIAKLDFNE